MKRVAMSIQIEEGLYSKLEKLRDEEHRPSMSNTVTSVLERAMARYEASEKDSGGIAQIDSAV